jgi:hypothetical protein
MAEKTSVTMTDIAQSADDSDATYANMDYLEADIDLRRMERSARRLGRYADCFVCHSD